MHFTHLPRSLVLLILFALTQNILAHPEPRADQVSLNSNQRQATLDPRSPEARQQRLEAWKAQKPMHTTALLAGAAATAVSESRLRNGRRRDLSCITGEQGMWMPANFLDEDDEFEKERGPASGSVRGEKVLEWDQELEIEDRDSEMDLSAFGMKDVLVRVWKELEKISFVVPRTRQPREKARDLDDGHDGDL